MKRVYVSSTYEDLREYRNAVTDVLRNCGYDVDAMEKYAARDDRPKAACEADILDCDIYVGIFAWRYGYVPAEDNPEGKSITELEYLAAGRGQKPRFIFLLADDAPWPSSQRDAEVKQDDGKLIRELRNRLKTGSWTAFFKSPDDLAKQVLISVLQYEATKRVDSLSAIEQFASAEVGPSYLPNIQQQIEQLGSVEFVAVRLGPTPWWNTRLHLVAALASDFTDIRQFALLDSVGRFLVMASPAEIRRALTKAQPKLEMAYLQARTSLPGSLDSSNIASIVANYQQAILAVFLGNERDVKRVMTPTAVRELGIKSQAEVFDQTAGERRLLLSADILRRHQPYVVLMRDGNMEGVVDRIQLASHIAKAVWE